ncbi:histidinol-phosphate transaminase [Ethanoligenens harbinense]|uniref:Histidinol-phosphate aminotransferase n=1 Tax=Ethanoligenens harbinense (strain DSM 18485 / JCM 12961 / CGMCC 1.5033 / YUAN-3) TaxID=663278 RepID=E6U7R2_ETHHY|nr:histidinol-phosphate transaminase [Ethanoligenens harbinense]ADU28185.1 histidinol-phosphate aminotransferase [Ethanoligenens harbinense YUAN-3]AVQ97187.1 histidinol-phosphate transaminase [Ethanoligenens harbinense YUAN-3]AYF39850.1 histidinol-phosphate transaminase [Ethanoligenens harbinense]AYF42682.1 histidinol-phosphate transaminase [Ethanoligenens harbinense]QCN93431.1 histidinol-phosphate transaminase [Ethanoligenens harbinense]
MDFLSKRARRMTPYTAGEQPKDMRYIKLNTNENPYPPSPRIREAIAQETDRLPLYPDPDATALCAAIAAVEGLDAGCVFCGNGSDEVLSFAFCAFFDDEQPVLFPDVTYSFYPVFAGFYNIPVQTVPLNERFGIDAADYFRPAGGVIFPNPNAPTGVYLDIASIRKLLDYHKDRVVVVDEAYIAFGGRSAAPLIQDYPNLLVVRTFSKSHALAGMRIGYALGQPHLIAALLRVKNAFNSYPVDRLAAAAAAAAVADVPYYTETAGKIVATRGRFVSGLRALGFTVLPSLANFVFAAHPGVPASDLFARLRAAGILVRYFDLPRISNYLRITVGTDEDMDRLLDVLAALLQQKA